MPVLFGDFELDRERRQLLRSGGPVPLEPKAFELLSLLVERRPRVLSRAQIRDVVWPGVFIAESTLNQSVNSIRQALEDDARQPRFIRTAHGFGYAFCAEARDTTDGQPRPSQVALEPKVELLPVPAPDPQRRFSLRRPWVWFAAAAVLVAAGLSAVKSRRASPEAAPPKAVPLTSLQGVVTSPSLSPDGTYVVFSWNGPKKDNPDLYVQQIGVTAAPLRLTSDPADDSSPSWSPDGRTIAFLRRGPHGGKTEVWRIAPLGGLERKVAETEPRLYSFPTAALAWCPDSTCLLVTDTIGADKPDALFQISLETGERRQLTHPQGLERDTDPGISPDGEWLIFRRSTNPGSGELYRLSLKDKEDSEADPVRLTSPMLWPTKPAWIPDSRDILFSAKGGLFRLDAMTGGTPSRLAFVDQDDRSPVVSRVPGGRRLVYVRAVVDTNVWRVDTARPGAPAASPPTAAIASTRFDMGPSVTPDGRRVVFVSDRSGENEFWVADPDGSNAFQLTSMAIAPGFPRWSPDQTMIVFHGNADMQRGDAMVVPVRGGQPRNLTKGMAGAFPSFSRDGQWIYFSNLEGGAARIMKMAATGGAPVQVTNGLMPIESYEGDLFYLDNIGGADSVWRLPRGGGPAVKVVEGVLGGCFDVVEGGLYYIDRVSGDGGSSSDRPGADTRLRYFDFATSQSMTVASNLGAVRHAGNSGGGLSATRDGRTVFFARTDSEINELMVVDNFR
jgi:Tol biopolymer transport system component/DNA-binding winged helix-turn-helix (wHTH) protein